MEEEVTRNVLEYRSAQEQERKRIRWWSVALLVFLLPAIWFLLILLMIATGHLTPL
jgi:hypothetical protein